MRCGDTLPTELCSNSRELNPFTGGRCLFWVSSCENASIYGVDTDNALCCGTPILGLDASSRGSYGLNMQSLLIGQLGLEEMKGRLLNEPPLVIQGLGNI